MGLQRDGDTHRPGAKLSAGYRIRKYDEKKAERIKAIEKEMNALMKERDKMWESSKNLSTEEIMKATGLGDKGAE